MVLIASFESNLEVLIASFESNLEVLIDSFESNFNVQIDSLSKVLMFFFAQKKVIPLLVQVSQLLFF